MKSGNEHLSSRPSAFQVLIEKSLDLAQESELSGQRISDHLTKRYYGRLRPSELELSNSALRERATWFFQRAEDFRLAALRIAEISQS